jgi:DNA-binding transcriptional LysR family regulator
VNFAPWSEEAFADLDRGRIDLAFSNDDVLAPTHLQSRLVYREDWKCIVARESTLLKRLTLERYLEEEHLAVSTLVDVQSIPDKRLATFGKTRTVRLRLPYFGAALECIAGTKLILTATSGVARVAMRRSDLRVMDAPQEISGFGFQAVWHPRLNHDPAHRWMRERIFELAKAL